MEEVLEKRNIAFKKGSNCQEGKGKLFTSSDEPLKETMNEYKYIINKREEDTKEGKGGMKFLKAV
ncbi:MAG: hypothetical protein ACERLG_11105 [Sedimentibacter sp.]